MDGTSVDSGWPAFIDAFRLRRLDPILLTLRANVGLELRHCGQHSQRELNLRTRKLGDMLMVDVHVDIAAEISVAAGHAIVQEVEDRARARHRVLGMMTHVDPWPMPDRGEP